ncbi:MAG: FtsL-like putative cell division protein [Bacteroidota bacterium]|nr:FtsL-like putative cell division protein [Bacteroidota bacterium]
MANTLKSESKTKHSSDKAGGKGLFALIKQGFKMEGLFDEGVPVRFLPQILWVTVLIILYISNAHYTEKTIRKIDKLKYEVEELRADYITTKAEYMKESIQSNIALKVKDLGLEESKRPPEIIKIEN